MGNTTEKKGPVIGVGIDTGGTYTDAVVYDFSAGQVLAKGKALTTKENLEIGIINALDGLPEELVRQAGILSLSTTLATNACVEDKGGRAKLILLGSSDKILKWIDAEKQYGLQNGDVLCIDSESVFASQTGEDAPWYQMLMEHEDWLSGAQALAVAEVPGMRNGAVCEKYTKKMLKDRYPVPFVMANELALGLNVMERGATALLNARLLPIIENFMKAVCGALQKRKLDIRQMIVRSDGSLMSDLVAKTYPVQTILSGPASSVIGARNLAECRNCMIVDMGGTTTDISLVKNGTPKMSDRIAIGGYRTQIRGVYIDTFGLGGDSRIVIRKGKAALDARRVQPLCVAAAEHPEMAAKLRTLVEEEKIHSLPLHEFLYLLKEPKDPQNYTGAELRLIEQLKNGPVMLGEGLLDIYSLQTERLEREEIIMRCGLTPTDIMHIRGDFSKYDKTASQLGAIHLMRNQTECDQMTLEEFCENIYDLVCRKLYVNLVKILAQDTYPQIFRTGTDQQISDLIELTWDQRKGAPKGLFGLNFRVETDLIGIGAPTHIFLPRVAEAMGVKCVIPPHAEVANAVGAITADVSARSQVRITPNFELDEEAYYVYTSQGRQDCMGFDNAVAMARKEAMDIATRDAQSRGAMGELKTQVDVDSNIAHDRNGTTIELDTMVTVSVSGRVYL